MKTFIKLLMIFLLMGSLPIYALDSSDQEGPINIHVSSSLNTASSMQSGEPSLEVQNLNSGVPGCGYIWTGGTDIDVTVNQESNDNTQFCQTTQFTGSFDIYASNHKHTSFQKICSVTYNGSSVADMQISITALKGVSSNCTYEGLQVVPNHGSAPIPLIYVAYKQK